MRRLAALVLAAAHCLALGQAGELPIQAGSSCREDFNATWSAAHTTTTRKLDAFREAKQYLASLRDEQLNQRIWWGHGPLVQSVDAMVIGDATQGIRLGANAVKRAIGIFVPEEQIVEGASARAIDWYARLKKGEKLADLAKLNGETLLWSLVKDTYTIAKVADALVKTADEFDQALQSSSRWEAARTEIAEQVASLDRQMADLDRKIDREVRASENAARDAFARACGGREPTDAADPAHTRAHGQPAGSPYGAGSPYEGAQLHATSTPPAPSLPRPAVEAQTPLPSPWRLEKGSSMQKVVRPPAIDNGAYRAVQAQCRQAEAAYRACMDASAQCHSSCMGSGPAYSEGKASICSRRCRSICERRAGC